MTQKLGSFTTIISAALCSRESKPGHFRFTIERFLLEISTSCVKQSGALAGVLIWLIGLQFFMGDSTNCIRIYPAASILYGS